MRLRDIYPYTTQEQLADACLLAVRARVVVEPASKEELEALAACGEHVAQERALFLARCILDLPAMLAPFDGGASLARDVMDKAEMAANARSR